MNHTPGPWNTWQKHDGYWKINGGPDGSIPIAGTANASSNPAQICSVQKANAHLIAAAPDLLACLSQLLECPDLNYDDLDNRTRPLIRNARTALAKATTYH